MKNCGHQPGRTGLEREAFRLGQEREREEKQTYQVLRSAMDIKPVGEEEWTRFQNDHLQRGVPSQVIESAQALERATRGNSKAIVAVEFLASLARDGLVYRDLVREVTELSSGAGAGKRLQNDVDYQLKFR